MYYFSEERKNMHVNISEAKEALDKIIQKARVHLYKPIQIAEILYHSRQENSSIEIQNISTYRNISKKWRNEVSIRLVGNKSTSSAKFQDNIFEENAVPPRLLAVLDIENKRHSGIVESYIYHELSKRLQDVTDAYEYINSNLSDTFSLQKFLNFFEHRPGLKRSVDKAYEIVVYALFSTLVGELNAKVSLTIDKPDPEILADFALFVKYVLGITHGHTAIVKPAKIYRTGVANAADRGLDMWANFGTAVQVKHIRLDAELANEITDEVATDDVVIVCKTAEANLIQSLLNQIGKTVRGIVTQDDLLSWYALCLTKYQERMGEKIMRELRSEFLQEFPSLGGLSPFLQERGYQKSQLTDAWQI